MLHLRQLLETPCPRVAFAGMGSSSCQVLPMLLDLRRRCIAATLDATNTRVLKGYKPSRYVAASSSPQRSDAFLCAPDTYSSRLLPKLQLHRKHLP